MQSPSTMQASGIALRLSGIVAGAFHTGHLHGQSFGTTCLNASCLVELRRKGRVSETVPIGVLPQLSLQRSEERAELMRLKLAA